MDLVLAIQALVDHLVKTANKIIMVPIAHTAHNHFAMVETALMTFHAFAM
jgi:hypothetical protein